MASYAHSVEPGSDVPIITNGSPEPSTPYTGVAQEPDGTVFSNTCAQFDSVVATNGPVVVTSMDSQYTVDEPPFACTIIGLPMIGAPIGLFIEHMTAPVAPFSLYISASKFVPAHTEPSFATAGVARIATS